MKALERFSPREQGVILAGAAVAALIVLYFFIAEPLYYGYGGMKGDIAKTAELVARYKAAVSGASLLDAEKNRYDTALKQLTDAVFVNETDALAAAQMAEMVRAKAAAAGIQVSSTRTERTEPMQGFRVVTLGVTFNAPLSGLSRFMLELQNDQKKIVVREAHITSQKDEWGDEQPESLSVRLVLAGLRYMPGEREMK